MHYVRLTGSDLREFKSYTENFGLVDPRAPHLMLWTKRGVARHAKMLDTDQAWDAFEALERAYFDRAVRPDVTEVLNDPAVLRQTLADYADKVIELQPKADAYDLIADTTDTYAITDAAKMLGQKPKDLFAWMNQNRWIYRRAGCRYWLAYEAKTRSGHMEHVYHDVEKGDGVLRSYVQPRVTGKGLSRLADAFSGEVA